MYMNLPAGQVLVDASPLDPDRLPHVLKDLIQRAFNGYVAWTGEGHDGLEEGVVLVGKEGILAVSYAHLKYGYVVDGSDALTPALNALRTKGLVHSVVSFTPPKMKLVLAFNEPARLQKPLRPDELVKRIPKAYDASWVRGIIKSLSSEELNRVRLLARYGLTGVEVGEI